MRTVLVLSNIRSNENVGSIFRTADAAGVYEIFLCGYTPGPLDRFDRSNGALLKASLGAEKFVKWQKFQTLREAVEELKRRGFKILAIEQTPEALDYRETGKLLNSGENLGLVFGNEVEGLSEEDLGICDGVAEIPMRGQKESLNVAVAVGIVLYQLLSN